MTPQFSIIVPSWQRADRLPRCLASVAAQDGAWECIVVDDGSTDATPTVVDARARRDPRFRGVRLPANRGASAARNAGIALARGTWLAFLDSDDEYLPGALATLAATAAAVPAARVVCGGLTGNMRVDARAAMDGRVIVRDALWEMLGFSIEGPRVQLIAAAFHCGVFDELGRFDESYRVSEDRELMIRVTARYPVAMSRRFVAHYHEGHGDGASDRSLVDGSKLTALRRMLRDLPPLADRRRQHEVERLRGAHLAMFDAVEEIRAERPAHAAAHMATAVRVCDAVEREALLIRLVYLTNYPAHRPRDAAARCARWLEAIARHAPAGLAGELRDAALGVQLWAAYVRWQSDARWDAARAVVAALARSRIHTAASAFRLLARYRQLRTWSSTTSIASRQP